MVRLVISTWVGTSDINSWQVQFNPPCSGYLRNINVRFRAELDGDYTIGFGKISADAFQRLPVTTDTFQIQQGRSTKTTQIWGSTTEKQVDGAISAANRKVHLHRQARLYLKNDELYMIKGETTGWTAGYSVLVEAEFIPYEKAYLKHTWHFNQLANSSNFIDKYSIPYALRNATVRMFGRVTSATGDSGVLSLRILDKDDFYPANTALIAGEGAFDSNILVSGESIPANNLYNIHVGSQETGLSAFDRTFPVTKLIHPGDGMSFDILQPTGTFSAGDLELFVEISGQVNYARRGFKALFVSGLLYYTGVE